MKGKDSVIIGDVLEGLRQIPDESVDCVMTSPPYWCYTDDTEILTELGWKLIKDIKLDEKVLTLNPENKNIYYQKVIDTIRYKYNGKMIEFKSRDVDICVTPNHRMYVEGKDGLAVRERKPFIKKDKLKTNFLVNAEDIKTSHMLRTNGFKWNGSKIKYFELPKLKCVYNKQIKIFNKKNILIVDWLKFFGFWLADGSVRGSKNNKNDRYGISIKQKQKVKDIENILKKLPFEYSKYYDKKLNIYNFEINDRQLWEYMKQFGNSYNKFIPREILSLDKKHLQTLLDWYLKGDPSYYSVSKILKDNIQEILIKLGVTSKINGDYISKFKWNQIKIGCFKNEVKYNGYVSCVTVRKDNIILVRRNGKILFSGNCLRDYGDEVVSIWDGDDNCDHDWKEIIKKPDGGRGSLNANVGANKNDVANLRDGDKISNSCNKCNAWKGQLGLEPTFELYVKHMADIFDEVQRVLRKTGTCFVNIGDTYFGGGTGQKEEHNGKYVKTNFEGMAKAVEAREKTGYKEKSLCMIPERFAIEMINRGWILRNQIIWHKPNAMPHPASDRYSVDFEKLFFFTKEKKYYFKPQREPVKDESIRRALRGRDHESQSSCNWQEEFRGYDDMYERYAKGELRGVHPDGRNKRTTWSITLKPGKYQHCAPYPEDLCESPIDAGCPKKVCVKCGTPVEYKDVSVGYLSEQDIEEKGVKYDTSKQYAMVEREGYIEVRDLPKLEAIRNYLKEWKDKSEFTVDQIENMMMSQAPHHWFSGESYPSKDDWLKLKDIIKFDDKFDKNMTEIKYKPAEKLKGQYKKVKVSCECNDEFEPGVVLDPFMGSGTTGIVALKQNKNFIGIELNPEYAKLCEKRFKDQLNESLLDYGMELDDD